MRTFVEVDSRVFLTQNLLGALLVVQTTEPDLGAVGKRNEPIGLRQRVLDAGEADLHDLGERVKDNRCFDVVETVTQNRVTGALRFQCTQYDVSHEQERLSGTGATEQHPVSGWSG